MKRENYAHGYDYPSNGHQSAGRSGPQTIPPSNTYNSSGNRTNYNVRQQYHGSHPAGAGDGNGWNAQGQDRERVSDEYNSYNGNNNNNSLYGFVGNEHTFVFAKAIGINDNPRGPFRSTSESLANQNPAETLRAYQQNTAAAAGTHGIKGFNNANNNSNKNNGSNDYSQHTGLGSTGAFFDDVYGKLHPEGKLERGGLAEKTIGTVTTRTVTKSFCEMATQTTEDHILTESTFNGVTIICDQTTGRTGSNNNRSNSHINSISSVRALHRPLSPVGKPPRTVDQTSQPNSQESEPQSETQSGPKVNRQPLAQSNNHQDSQPNQPQQQQHLQQQQPPPRPQLSNRPIPSTSKDVKVDSWMDAPTSASKSAGRSHTIDANDDNDHIRDKMASASESASTSSIAAASDGWGKVADKKSVGDMVDWSTGLVAAFPDEAKPTHMKVAHHKPHIQPKAPVQQLQSSWGRQVKRPETAQEPRSHPHASTQGQSPEKKTGPARTQDDPWHTEANHPRKTTVTASGWGEAPSIPAASRGDGHQNDSSDARGHGGDGSGWVTGNSGNTDGSSWGFMPPAGAAGNWNQTVGTTAQESSTSWGDPPELNAKPATRTGWDDLSPQPPSAPQPEVASPPSGQHRHMPLTSTERFNRSLQKQALDYGGPANNNDGWGPSGGLHQDTNNNNNSSPQLSMWGQPPQSGSSATTSTANRWDTHDNTGSEENERSNNHHQYQQSSPSQPLHRRTPSNASSTAHSTTNPTSPKLSPFRDTAAQPQPFKPTARRVQKTNPEREHATAKWKAASAAFSGKHTHANDGGASGGPAGGGLSGSVGGDVASTLSGGSTGAGSGGAWGAGVGGGPLSLSGPRSSYTVAGSTGSSNAGGGVGLVGSNDFASFLMAANAFKPPVKSSLAPPMSNSEVDDDDQHDSVSETSYGQNAKDLDHQQDADQDQGQDQDQERDCHEEIEKDGAEDGEESHQFENAMEHARFRDSMDTRQESDDNDANDDDDKTEGEGRSAEGSQGNCDRESNVQQDDRSSSGKSSSIGGPEDVVDGGLNDEAAAGSAWEMREDEKTDREKELGAMSWSNEVNKNFETATSKSLPPTPSLTPASSSSPSVENHNNSVHVSSPDGASDSRREEQDKDDELRVTASKRLPSSPEEVTHEEVEMSFEVGLNYIADDSIALPTRSKTPSGPEE
ncbi:hypothetical protein BG004_007461 [Podila humilis]|nr:hypothetical protein BG004_007461 [Podila humilis]